MISVKNTAGATRRNLYSQPLFQDFQGHKLVLICSTTKGKNFLLIIDYFSRWIEMPQLRYITPIEVFNHLTNQFQDGDSLRKLDATEVHKKSPVNKEYSAISSTTSTPCHLLIIHRAMVQQSALFRQLKELPNKKNSVLALLSYRRIPLEVTGFSPAQQQDFEQDFPHPTMN